MDLHHPLPGTMRKFVVSQHVSLNITVTRDFALPSRNTSTS